VSESNLSLEEAQNRSYMIKSVQYALNLVLPKGKNYAGSIEIKFVLAKTGFLFLDYSGTHIGDIIINGTHVEAEKIFENHKIVLPKEYLNRGENYVFFL